MIIDSKLPGFKSFIAENRLNNAGVKTTIDQSAVAAAEQNSVFLDLQDEAKQLYEKNKKKKEEKARKKAHDDLEKNKKKLSNEESKIQNLKLLNLL